MFPILRIVLFHFVSKDFLSCAFYTATCYLRESRRTIHWSVRSRTFAVRVYFTLVSEYVHFMKSNDF